MAQGETAGPIHPEPTRRSGYRYFFHVKHHGQGGPDDSRWLSDLSQAEEFAIFDAADFHALHDDQNRLYGLRRSTAGEILELGTGGQQVAEFPLARPNEAWHGYPLWPLKEQGPANRKGEKHRPSKEVFQKMEAAGLLTARQRTRLYKGDHV